MTIKTALLLTAVAIASAFVVACGDGEATSGAAGNDTDRAFVAEMIPHHRSAVEMAEIAKTRGQHAEIKQLADGIVATQNAEIERMQRYDRQLEDAAVKVGDLGMAEQDMGGHMDAAMLRDAKPFDRDFIDTMIPHHQGAIRMAHVELDKGANAELKRLAQDIVDAQSKEIDDMNMRRVDWYGALSPAGGTPSNAGGEHSDGHGM
jgi:uncharacterized protein (DUF305 family)